MILQYSESYVSGSSSDVQNFYYWIFFAISIDPVWREAAELVDEAMFPVPVDAHRHKIVHDVVLVGNRVKDLVYEWLLLLCGNVGETEVIVLLFG